MDAVFKGLVIPKVAYIGEIMDDFALNGPFPDYPEYKRYMFFVWADSEVLKFDDKEKEKLEDFRNKIIDKVNEYYASLTFKMRSRPEKEF